MIKSKIVCSTGTPNLSEQVISKKPQGTIRGLTQCTKLMYKACQSRNTCSTGTPKNR